jgi:hypothetical protein
MFSSVWSDKMKEPIIVTINGHLRVYSGIASKIIKHIREENNGIEIEIKGLGIRIPEDTTLLNTLCVNKTQFYSYKPLCKIHV